MLGDADWLTAHRARAWCRVLAGLMAAALLGDLALSRGGLDVFGKPLGTDFVSFWTASRLALSGHPEAAYNPALHEAAERALFPRAASGYYAFFYPPSFLLCCLPLALAPYLLSLAAWLLGGFAILATCLRRLLPQRWAILPILALPGTVVNAGHGQNGFITAGCLGWCLVLCGRRPFVAGLCLGVLVIKPQLLVAAPVALLAARRWRLIAGALTSAIGLCALSWLVFGTQTWRLFLRGSASARATLEQRLVEPWKMTSVFACVRLLHGGITAAYLLQGAVTIAACLLLAWSVTRRPGARAELALLIAATPICTPFLLDYDLLCLMIPVAWVAAQAVRNGWLAWEKLVLLSAITLPLAARPVAMTTGVAIAPVVMLALFGVVVRRCEGWGVVHSTRSA